MKISFLTLFLCLPFFAFSQGDSKKGNTQVNANEPEGAPAISNIPDSLMMEVYRYDPIEAQQLYVTGLTISEKKGYQEAMSWAMDKIGEIYFDQKNYDRSFQYYSKALSVHQQLNAEPAIAYTLSQIGKIREEQKKYELALNYYLQSWTINKKINDLAAMGNGYIDIGHVYFKLQEYPKALENYTTGLHELRKASEPKGIAIATCNLGEYYIQQNNNGEAVKYLEESYKISEELGIPQLIKHSSHLLSLAYEKKGDGLLSVKLYKRYAFMKDSVEHDANRKIAIRKEVQFEVEKDRMAKEQAEIEKQKQEQQRIGRRNGLQYSFIFIAILFVLGITSLLGFIKVSHYLAEGFIFVSVLILFEFILVLTDPYVDGLTSGIPIYKLIMNTLLAVLVFPLHALFERKLKKRLKK